MSQSVRRPEPPPNDRPSYVLVVDDEDVVRRFLVRCLESGGYTVKQAATAIEAIELMTINAAAVMLCDVRMPEHDGLWLVGQVRERWPETRVVMASALADLDTVRECRDLGAVDYITKPIMPAQLLKVVRRAETAPTDVDELALADEEAPRPAAAKLDALEDDSTEAEYTLESPVRCPSCAERITSIKAVRLIRVQVNFTSTLPRRGRVVVCPHCVAVLPAELSNF
jgi:CheY-like chemotaxis protein